MDAGQVKATHETAADAPSPPRLLAIGVILLLALALWPLLVAPLRRTGLSALFLLDVLTSYLTDSRFEAASLVTPSPGVEERRLIFREERIRLTIYSPGRGEPRGGILLVNGAVELGNEDPGIRRVATSLARLGFLVALPELASLQAFLLDPHDPDRLVGAFEALSAEPALRAKPVGFVGFCFGASLGLLAASDPAIADHVSFVAGAIPYARLDTLVVDVLSGSAVGTNGLRPWEPREDLAEKLPLALIGLLPDADDRDILRSLHESDALATREADLSLSGEALRRLLLTRDRLQAEALVAEQDPALIAALEQLSPLDRIDRLRAPLFLFHSAADRVIPWEHSAALAAAAPTGGRLEVSTLLQHTRLILDPRQWRLMLGYPREAWDLVVLLNEVLAAAGVR